MVLIGLKWPTRGRSTAPVRSASVNLATVARSMTTWPVGGADYEDLFPGFEAVHLSQELIDNAGTGTRLQTNKQVF